MPQKSKRSPPKKKPKYEAKAKKKPVLRSVKSSPKMEAKSPPKGSSILWKILAERERRSQQQPPKQYASHRGTQYPPQEGKHEQFARYAGPRRRAA